MVNNKDSEWQKLDWAKKVEICNQSIANADSTLLTFVIMFIAFEAMLFAILIGAHAWDQLWSRILASLGIVFVIPYMLLFERKGNDVDHWGAKLYWLWRQEPDIAKQYKGCCERICKRKGKCGWWKVMFGWGYPLDIGRFHSTRRWFTTFIPLLIVIVWIFLMVSIP